MQKKVHPIDELLAYQLEGKTEEAWKISEEIENAGPDKCYDPSGKVNPETWIRHSFNRGWFLLQQGDYQKGSQLLENGRFISVYGSGPLQTNKPLYNPNEHSIKDKSIIISLEGGYGDEIIHARFATNYKKLGAKKVYLAAAPELVSIFERIEGVDKVILRNEAHTVEHDFWVPGFSAGWVAGVTFDNFPNKPYLYPRKESVDLWKQIINTDKKKIGIRWAGNPKFEHQQFRRFPPEFMINLSKYEDVQIYSLQRDHNVQVLPSNIIDLQHFLLSWEDTMACIDNLDLIITSCTSIAHIAAAMGKETWVTPPILPYHTWAYGAPKTTTSPYYESVRLFRQKTANKWNDTFQELYTELEKKFDLKHVEMPNEDKVLKRLNLGCGLMKLDGYLNVDNNSMYQPDANVDLNVTPWPWKDNEFGHIVAKDVLEHLGDSPDHFLEILKEMYRVSDNGCVWEVQVPHWRCDIALDDPTHRRCITLGTFMMFNQKKLFDRMRDGMSDSMLCFEQEIDLEVCDVEFDYNPHWQQLIKENKISQEDLNYALNTFNNVALSMRVLVQVNKPNRVSKGELEAFIAQKQYYSEPNN
jgi:hypothetical protein